MTKRFNWNYKIVTLILAGLLMVTYAWHWEAIFDYKADTNMNMSGMNMDTNMNMGDMTMNDMVKMMQGKTGKALEKEFITGMIPHHQGAVDMAKLLLQDKTINPEIRAFAENIIKAQDSEILMMNKWLKNY